MSERELIPCKGNSGTPRNNTRHSGCEYLRCLAALLVVINHAWFLEAGNSSPFHLFSTCTVYTIASMSVPVFVMLSGAFLIRNERNISPRQFWAHSFKKLFPLCFAFLVLAFFWQSSLWEGYMTGKYNFSELILLTIRWYGNGAVVPLWFICMLPGLYFVLPFIARIWKTIRFKYFVAISIILYVLKIAYDLCGMTFPHPFSAVSWLGHFMLGCVIITLAEKKQLPTIKTLSLVTGAMLILFIPYLYHQLENVENIYSDLGLGRKGSMPIEYVLNILLFCLFAQIRTAPRVWVLTLSQLSLLIYLTHAPCQRIIRAILFHTGYIDQLHASALNNALYALASIIFSVVASLIIHRAYGKIVELTKRLSQKFNMQHQHE